jgi:hypothetical protein
MNPGDRHHFINHSTQITVETAVVVLQLRRLADADRMIAARYLEALRQCRELLRRLISLTRP